MIAKKWRERLTYLAMSLFVTWHTIGMLVGPTPDSAISRAARVIWDPYLNYLRLDSTWTFFAPEIGKQTEFRYIVEDADGGEHRFTPTREMSPLHPKIWWFKYVYQVVFILNPELFGDAPTRLLCQKHASLRPVAITVFEVQEEGNFRPEDQLRGKHPLDPEYITINSLRRLVCPHELSPRS